MSARKARTEAAAAGAAPVDSEEKDVKIPVEAVDDTEVNEAAAAEAAENQVEDSNKEATMTEDEMVEAAIRAGEEAADNDFKLKFEQAQKELADVRSELDAAAEAQKAAEDKAKDATERTARLQADWENFRRRTANERIAERERATEKLVTALLPVVDDIEPAARSLPTTLSSSSMALTRCMPSCSMCLRTRALSPSIPRARRSIRSSTRPWGVSRTHRSTTRPSTTCTRRATAWRTASCAPRW